MFKRSKKNKVELITVNHQYRTRNQASSRHGIPEGSIKTLENDKSEFWKLTVKSWNKKLKAISQETSQTSSVHAVGQMPAISFDKLSLPVLKKIVKDHYISLY